MKILHVVHGYFPALGGSERLMQRVSENLVSRYGDEVTVYTANGYNTEAFVNPAAPLLPVGEETLNGVRIRRFAVFNRLGKVLFHVQRLAYGLKLPGNEYLRTWYGGPILPGLGRCIRAFEADIVAATAFPLLHMYTTLRACRRSNKPVVLHGALHPLYAWGFDRPMIYRAIRQADAYIANTTYERDYLIDQWHILPDKITVIGVGITPERFERASGVALRRQYGIGSNPLVAFIGQQGRNKGIDTLIRAMKLVWQVVPQAYLLIAGATTHFTAQLQALVQNELAPAQQARIIWINNFDEADKPTLFAACDVFAYLSRYESFGIAFIEAWAAGKPVVGCDAGAVSSVIDDEIDGLLVPVDNPVSSAEALIRLLQSETLRQRLGQAGREKVHSRYTWDVIMPRWRGVYERVLAERARRVRKAK